MGFFVPGGQRIVSTPGVRPPAGVWRRPQEAEHELTFGERSPCSRRARAGAAQGGGRRAGVAAGWAGPVGGGLRARGGRRGPAGGRAGGWVGRGGGAAGPPGEGAVRGGGVVGRGRAARGCGGRPPARARQSMAAAAQPAPRGLARRLQCGPGSNRLSRLDVSAPPPRPPVPPLPRAGRLSLPPPPSGSGFPDAPAGFCCHCDVTKGRAGVEPSPPP